MPPRKQTPRKRSAQKNLAGSVSTAISGSIDRSGLIMKTRRR